jgi:regulator of cell morphogenesis and NO signaling
VTKVAADARVGELVVERPARARVFEQFGIDYCCGGKKTLLAACAEKDVDAGDVLAALGALDDDSGEEEDWSEASLTALCAHIETVHHAFLRSELPRLAALVDKVTRAHGSAHPELAEVQEVYRGLVSELESHIEKEEGELFPAIRHLEESGARASLAAPISTLEHEHDDTGSALERLRALTAGYAPPQGACNSYRAMLDGLEQLERDLHTHIHEENNILFARALAA